MRVKAHRKSTRWFKALGCVVAGVVVAVPAATPAVAAPTLNLRPECTVHVLNVRLADPGPAAYQLWGKLCQRPGSKPNAVQVLQPGGTYNHLYWENSYRGGIYSYEVAATLAGYATFTFDRIGTGNSTFPPFDELSMAGEAVALHDVVTALRAGAVGGRSFPRVITVGHSFSSMISAVEAARYQDVDGHIHTGIVHAVADAAFEFGAHAHHAANDDPKFAGMGLDGYQTTIPGVRGAFYSPATSNAEIVALDEANKDVHTTAEGPEGFAFLQPPTPADAITQQVAAPVLLLLGGDDFTFCGAGGVDCSSAASVRAHEAQYWHDNGAKVTFAVVPGVGHSIHLSTAEPVAAAIMLAWSYRIARP
jgi:pimeloyl-ACP methyl ester carboxylesterase